MNVSNNSDWIVKVNEVALAFEDLVSLLDEHLHVVLVDAALVVKVLFQDNPIGGISVNSVYFCCLETTVTGPAACAVEA